MPSTDDFSVAVHTQRRARVQLPQAVSALDYAIPDGMYVCFGAFVLVELRKKHVIGLVTALSDDAEHPITDQPDKKIRYKPILAIYEHIPPFQQRHINFLHWLADYYMVPVGLAYRLSFPSKPDFYSPPTPTVTFIATEKPVQGLTDKQQHLYDTIIANRGGLAKKQLLQESQGSSQQLKALITKGLITEVPFKPTAKAKNPSKLASLSPDQELAFQQLSAEIHKPQPKTCLLDGITGSGKTEVYFHLIAKVLAEGKQILVLLPEVSLIIDWQQRFFARFGCHAAIWHNGITPKTRSNHWQGAARGETQIIVGARSALHIPMPNLALIILDEEHDFSYKQDDGVPYHARDMAVVRAHLSKALLVLASATPSLESLENVRKGKYCPILLTARHKAASQPIIHLIDTKKHRPKTQQWLSQPLIDAIEETRELEQQSLLFLNRRGFAPLLLCRLCNYRFQCPNCDVYLNEHRLPQPHLACHHCGHKEQRPNSCPDCGDEKHLSSSGPGVERIITEITEHFPSARTFAATAETLDNPEAIENFLNGMKNRQIDIIVGTQIIAKGLDFPYLTLAGIIDADQALFGSNPRAAEQTWQLLHQIAGRTGRHHLAGRAFLQTQKPEDNLFQSLQTMNRDSFIQQQAKIRQAAKIPPFGRMVAVIIQAQENILAETTARQLVQSCPQPTENNPHRILGPMPAPIARLRGWYRHRLLLMSEKHVPLQPIVQDMLNRTQISSKVRIKVDVDPYNFV